MRGFKLTAYPYMQCIKTGQDAHFFQGFLDLHHKLQMVRLKRANARAGDKIGMVHKYLKKRQKLLSPS